VQAGGTCWLGGTAWRGMAAMRISVSNWSTTTHDVDRSIDAILTAARLPAATGAGNRREAAGRSGDMSGTVNGH
jgi:hypothetical protein